MYKYASPNTVINFSKRASNEKALLDRYRSTFDKETRSIKVTPPIKVTPFHGTSSESLFSSFDILRTLME